MQTSNVPVLRSIGLTSIETEIQLGQLMVFLQILMLDPDNIYKRVARVHLSE